MNIKNTLTKTLAVLFLVAPVVITGCSSSSSDSDKDQTKEPDKVQPNDDQNKDTPPSETPTVHSKTLSGQVIDLVS